MLKEFVREEDGLSKEEYKQYYKHYQKEITALQQKLKETKLPVIVLVEGGSLSGKTVLVNELISEVDPRFSSVFVSGDLKKKSLKRPFVEPFFNAIPESGKLLFMEGGWVFKSVGDYMSGKITGKQYEQNIEEINVFERQLKNDGYVLIKLFLTIPKKLLKKRLALLKADRGAEWMLNSRCEKEYKHYEEYRICYDDFLSRNNPGSWHIIDSSSGKTLKYDAFKIVYEEISAAVKKGRYKGKPYKEAFPMVKMPMLSEVDLSPSVSKEEYKPTLEYFQEKLHSLQDRTATAGIPVVIALEGWDAAGKGGAIRRIAYPMDPRLFTVHPIASPEPHEKARHHLWRFWTRMPENGRIAIFDRTWYGRVMVERLEGFCSENDWKRAYAEINEFERTLTQWGAVVIKFWLQIDKDTQLARFTERQNTPEKQWKITDEDWRNREKWDLYETAVNDMIQKTSTEYAPWEIVEANDKLFARLRVIETVCARLEEALEGRK